MAVVSEEEYIRLSEVHMIIRVSFLSWFSLDRGCGGCGFVLGPAEGVTCLALCGPTGGLAAAKCRGSEQELQVCQAGYGALQVPTVQGTGKAQGEEGVVNSIGEFISIKVR